MKTLMNRMLQAYRPLYLHGLLMDGQYRIPSAEIPADPLKPTSGPASRKRMLLVALGGPAHLNPSDRSSS
ncbi:MAG: hypothetical protein ABI870_16125 [Rhodanobacter sp.]